MASKSPLMVSISGVRGIVGKSFTPEVIVRYVRAFCGLFPGEDVILGRDSRVSGPWVSSLVASVARSCGKNVTDIGIVATPTVQLAVLQLKAGGGGIVVTSSHNPVEWNGLKFIAPDSLFCGAEQCARLYADDAVSALSEDAGGSLRVLSDYNERHVAAVLATPAVAERLEAVREARFRVALDTVHGAGGAVMSALLKAMHCEVVTHLYAEPSGRFPRPPEPIPQHLTELGEAVRSNNAALGIAVDPDVDRCVLLAENGEALGEEYTLVAAVHYLIVTLNRRGAVVRNLSSSRASDDIANQHECPVIATPVGEVHVARAMLAQQPPAIIGGEGNGGVLLPDLHLGRDAPVAAALALCFLQASGEKHASAAWAKLPRYAIAKLKAPMVPHFDRCVEAVAARCAQEGGASINKADGVRIDQPAGWVHLRKSNTEPVYRVIGEYGETLESSTAHCQKIMDEVAQLSARFEAEAIK